VRANQFPSSTLQKFRLPATWGVIAVYALAWGFVWLLLDMPRMYSAWGELLLQVVTVAAQVALAPLPWLWTGDDRPKAAPLRGLVQAVLWNLAWIGLVMGSVFALFPGTVGGLPPMQLHWFGHRLDCPPQLVLMLVNFPLAMILGWFLAEKERAEAAHRELRALADQARLQALQAQLNPHSLFNILGGLAELVREDPLAAEDALVCLTGMYRTLTRHGSALTAPLRAERTLLEQYLEIEDMRLGKRLDLEWRWPAWADSLELPPLLLQPLVENAIKHGIAPDPEGGAVRIEVARAAGALVLTVANTGQPLADGAPEGTGLGNLRQRLALLGPLQPSFELFRDGQWTLARLTLAWRWDA
jgi:hypothetical protein